MIRQDDFTRLSDSWMHWSRRASLTRPSISEQQQGDEIHFLSDEYSVHLRYADGQWVVDTLNDRGQLRKNVAEFSSYDLAEKFLIWQWSSAARNALRLPRLGRELYDRGMSPDVEAQEIGEGIYELRVSGQRAVLMEPSATIFSHLMSMSVDEIDGMVKSGINEP